MNIFYISFQVNVKKEQDMAAHARVCGLQHDFSFHFRNVNDVLPLFFIIHSLKRPNGFCGWLIPRGQSTPAFSMAVWIFSYGQRSNVEFERYAFSASVSTFK